MQSTVSVKNANQQTVWTDRRCFQLSKPLHCWCCCHSGTLLQALALCLFISHCKLTKILSAFDTLLSIINSNLLHFLQLRKQTDHKRWLCEKSTILWWKMNTTFAGHNEWFPPFIGMYALHYSIHECNKVIALNAYQM